MVVLGDIVGQVEEADCLVVVAVVEGANIQEDSTLTSNCNPPAALVTLACILMRVLGSIPKDSRVVRLRMSIWAPVSATA